MMLMSRFAVKTCITRVLISIFGMIPRYGRDLKEKMAGPGDDYAKDTRAYNPDFAKDHPEEEYETKIQEVRSIASCSYIRSGDCVGIFSRKRKSRRAFNSN